MTLRPDDTGRHGRQYAVDIAAGFKPEHRSTIIKQVEFDISPALAHLALAILFRKGFGEPAGGYFGININKGAPDILREGKIGLPVSRVQVVVENAAGAARFFAVR